MSSYRGHDIIVIGGSIGSVSVLQEILSNLKPELKASVFIVYHIAANSPNMFPDIISNKTKLKVKTPVNGEEIEQGVIYFPQPDNHIMIHGGYVKIAKGPQENRWRPSIDPLFRSAAVSYGPRSVGILLSGYLDDGVSGLAAIKKMAGITIIQDPNEAAFPDMPLSALNVLTPDYILKSYEIADVLTRLSQQPTNARVPIPEDLQMEVKLSESVKSNINLEERMGELVPQVCPDCSGPMWKHEEEKMARFRCHVGHSYTEKTLLAEQSKLLQDDLVKIIRKYSEYRNFVQDIVNKEDYENHRDIKTKLEKQLHNIDKTINVLHDLL